MSQAARKSTASPQAKLRLLVDGTEGEVVKITSHMTVSKVVQATREGLGWTQSDLAYQAGCCVSTVQRLEQRSRDNVSGGWFNISLRILSALGYTLQITR